MNPPTSGSAGSVRPQVITVAPAARNARAMPAPTPRVPPVTSTTAPSSPGHDDGHGPGNGPDDGPGDGNGPGDGPGDDDGNGPGDGIRGVPGLCRWTAPRRRTW